MSKTYQQAFQPRFFKFSQKQLFFKDLSTNINPHICLVLLDSLQSSFTINSHSNLTCSSLSFFLFFFVSILTTDNKRLWKTETHMELNYNFKPQSVTAATHTSRTSCLTRMQPIGRWKSRTQAFFEVWRVSTPLSSSHTSCDSCLNKNHWARCSHITSITVALIPLEPMVWFLSSNVRRDG